MDDASPHPERQAGAFFGRRHGKSLRGPDSEALAAVLPGRLIALESGPPVPLAALFDAPVKAIRLEIGFGGGEHLHHIAGTQPATGFIGVEPFVNGMAKLCRALANEPRANIRLYDQDAAELLDWLPEASIAGIDLFYPDPWPKRRHWKRRFVSVANLDRFARVMAPGAAFRFASDIDHYVNWTLEHVIAHPAFEWVATGHDDWQTPYPGWPGTRYEAKAIREGRVPAYLTFLRA